MLFGGAAGNWFGPEGSLFARLLQLAAGSLFMGAAVSLGASLLFGRNAIRWGIGTPFLVYLGGVLVAAVFGREGASLMLFAAPLMLGLAFAAGVMTAFLSDGLFSRQGRARAGH